MSAIETLLRQPGPQAIGWALLQFVWQGAVIGLLTAIVLAALRRSAADVRYVVSAISLSLMLTMPVVTAIQAWPSVSPPAEPSQAEAAAPTAQSSYTAAATVPSVEPLPDCATESCMTIGGSAANVLLGRPRVEPWLPVLLLVWMAGVLLLTLRLVSGWWWVQRMKTHGAATARDSWQQMAVRLSRRLHIRRGVRLLESTVVDVPTVIGWLRPVILLPASALAAA
ncbi:MAG: hypothetical protein LC753_03275 [Acidobacteria bacterium]|nr:hypothetical protein [Acidobacteriota bacterium]